MTDKTMEAVRKAIFNRVEIGRDGEQDGTDTEIAQAAISAYHAALTEQGVEIVEIERLRATLDAIEGQAVCVNMDGLEDNERILVHIAELARSARSDKRTNENEEKNLDLPKEDK